VPKGSKQLLISEHVWNSNEVSSNCGLWTGRRATVLIPVSVPVGSRNFLISRSCVTKVLIRFSYFTGWNALPAMGNKERDLVRCWTRSVGKGVREISWKILNTDTKNSIFWYIIPTRCTSHRVCFIWQLLYMFRASLSPIFRSTKLHLQHLVTITL